MQTSLNGSALHAWQQEQTTDWGTFRNVVSNVGVDVHGMAVSRVGFRSTVNVDEHGMVAAREHVATGTAETTRDTNGEVVGSLSLNPRAVLLHLYPELA